MWAQIIDLASGKTLVSANTKGLKFKDKTKTEQAYLLGKHIAKKSLKNGVKQVAFDRGPYRYHGRVEALAEGAREGGLRL